MNFYVLFKLRPHQVSENSPPEQAESIVIKQLNVWGFGSVKQVNSIMEGLFAEQAFVFNIIVESLQIRVQ